MSTSVADLNDSIVYLDTMVPYALLRGLEPTAQTLFERIEAAELLAITSVLTFDELAYRLLLAAIREHVGGSPLDRLRGAEAAMIERFYPAISVQLRHLYTFPNLQILDITEADLTRMDEAMRQYQLRPRDALHLAAMQKAGCFTIISNDGDWDRVPVVRRYTLP